MTVAADFFVITLPLLIITILGRIFPANNQPYHPKFQPPNWVFPIIWTYITLTFGLVTYASLLHTSNKEIIIFLYSLILIGLNGWLVINSRKDYKKAFQVLVFTCFLSIIYVVTISKDTDWVYALLPMPFWLVLASCLNGVIYDRVGIEV